MEKFQILYGNGTKTVIDAKDLLAAQKEGHKRAKQKKTICIRVTKHNL